MDFYIDWVKNNMILSAAIHFAVLGTLGEIISLKLRNIPLKNYGTSFQIILKILGWAFLGIFIKFGFIGMKGFTKAVFASPLFFDFSNIKILNAFFISVFTNVFFGPQMMLLHRLEDNLIMNKKNFKGLMKALKTLLWFWIPAHTLTFMLQDEFQIVLAAFWSVVLSLIMGLSSSREKA